MAKQTQIDKAIDALIAERDALTLKAEALDNAISKLISQQTKKEKAPKATRGPRVVKTEPNTAA